MPRGVYERKPRKKRRSAAAKKAAIKSQSVNPLHSYDLHDILMEVERRGWRITLTNKNV